MFWCNSSLHLKSRTQNQNLTKTYTLSKFKYLYLPSSASFISWAKRVHIISALIFPMFSSWGNLKANTYISRSKRKMCLKKNTSHYTDTTVIITLFINTFTYEISLYKFSGVGKKSWTPECGDKDNYWVKGKQTSLRQCQCNVAQGSWWMSYAVCLLASKESL